MCGVCVWIQREREREGERVCATDVAVCWCIDVWLCRVCEKHLCNYFVIPSPHPPSWSCKALRDFKDKRLKIAIIIIIIIAAVGVWLFSIQNKNSKCTGITNHYHYQQQLVPKGECQTIRSAAMTKHFYKMLSTLLNRIILCRQVIVDFCPDYRDCHSILKKKEK